MCEHRRHTCFRCSSFVRGGHDPKPQAKRSPQTLPPARPLSQSTKYSSSPSLCTLLWKRSPSSFIHIVHCLSLPCWCLLRQARLVLSRLQRKARSLRSKSLAIACQSSILTRPSTRNKPHTSIATKQTHTCTSTIHTQSCLDKITLCALPWLPCKNIFPVRASIRHTSSKPIKFAQLESTPLHCHRGHVDDSCQ